MTKSEFMNELRRLLGSLRKDEIEKTISYYDEMIEDYKESGLSEEDVIEKIGTPKSIADTTLKDQNTVEVKIPSSNSKVLNIILLVLGFPLWGSILLAAILLVLSAYIIVWCGPFVTGVCSVSFFAAAIISVVGAPFVMAEYLNVGVVQLGIGVMLIGISILLGLLTIYLSKMLIGITKKMTLKFLDLFKRKVVRVC